jgi:hypothetical protein
MQEFAQRCGGCLEVSYDPHDVKVQRFPGAPTAHVVNVLAKLKGRTDPRRVVVFTGHFDSCVCSVDARDATSDAPGANDDASGSAPSSCRSASGQQLAFLYGEHREDVLVERGTERSHDRARVRARRLSFGCYTDRVERCDRRSSRLGMNRNE